MLGGLRKFEGKNGSAFGIFMTSEAIHWFSQLAQDGPHYISQAARKEMMAQTLEGNSRMRAFMHERFGNFPEPVPSLLAQTQSEHFWIFESSQLFDNLPPFYASLQGRFGDHKVREETKAASYVALIGDSAHPFSSFTSEGIGSAVLDAQTLTDLLCSALDASRQPTDSLHRRLQSALARYEDIRRPLCDAIRADGEAQEIRFVGGGGEARVPISSGRGKGQ